MGLPGKYPPTPFSPSLISLVVSMDVKHHVCDLLVNTGSPHLGLFFFLFFFLRPFHGN